jgi:hypothetical protein
MLVRVGSTVCCGKAGSASAGATTSGSGGTEASTEGCAGTPASGRSALMWFLLAPFGTIVTGSTSHVPNPGYKP